MILFHPVMTRVITICFPQIRWLTDGLSINRISHDKHFAFVFFLLEVTRSGLSFLDNGNGDLVGAWGRYIGCSVFVEPVSCGSKAVFDVEDLSLRFLDIGVDAVCLILSP